MVVVERFPARQCIIDGNIDYADLLNWADHYDINKQGSFLSSSDADRLSRALGSSSSASRNLKDAVSAVTKNTKPEWNVAAIVCGDRSSGLEASVFYGSGSIDGSMSSFWALEWDSLSLSWKSADHTVFISCSYKPLTKSARLLRDRGLAPYRLYIDTNHCSEEISISTLKESQKSQLLKNGGYSL